MNHSLSTVRLGVSPIPVDKLKDPSVTELKLADAKYEDAEVIIIASLLAVNKSITILDLSNNPFGDEGAHACSNVAGLFFRFLYT